jgi:hypothetical protein
MNPERSYRLPNRLLVAGSALLGMALCQPPMLQAQATDTPPQTTQGVAAPKPNQQAQMANRVAHPPTPKRELKHLTKMLGLSAAQQEKMLPLLRHRREQMEQIRNNASLTPQERHRLVRSLMTDTRQKMEDAMTEAQKQQFEQMLQRGRERARERRME